MPSPIVDTLQPFFWGRGGARLTPEQIAREREIAEALLKNGIDFSPVGHWLQGAARLANAVAGKVTEGRTKKAEEENARVSSEVLQRLLESSGSTAFATPALTGSAPNSAPLDPISSRVAQAHDAVQISGNKQEFVNALLPYAIEESKRTGIDPRIIVAQAALETGWGRSAPGNNYFGIKSHGQGGGQTLATTEVINGRPVRVRDSFRTYASPADSVRGYGDFILQNPRYRAMREAQGLDAQLEALGASGYATDPNYAQKVGAIARGITIPDMATAYAPAGGPPTGALAAAPFPSAGLPAAPEAAPASGVTVAPDGGRLVNPLDLPENKITFNYVDENGNPLPDQGDGGDPVVRQAPVDTSIWGGGMDPNDPSTIPAIAGGTRDVTAAPTGYFPPAPAPVGAAPAPAGPAVNPAIIEALTSPYVDENTKRIATLLLQQQLDPMQRLEMEYKQAQIAKMQREAAGGNTTYGLNPIYGTDPKTGKTVLGVLGNDGTFKPVDTGGIEVSTGVEKVDLGTHYGLLDKRSGQMVGTLPKDLYEAEREKAAGGVAGKATEEARFVLPRVENDVYTAIGIIDSVLNDPYLDKMVGPVRSRLPDITADAARVRSKLDQIHGQAFMQAYERLKGGGQITEIEGQKATQAMVRLNEAQSPEDFRQALNELRTIIMGALARARRAAGLGGSDDDGWQDIGGVKIRRKQ